MGYAGETSRSSTTPTIPDAPSVGWQGPEEVSTGGNPAEVGASASARAEPGVGALVGNASTPGVRPGCGWARSGCGPAD
jgi:hypothetical protein